MEADQATQIAESWLFETWAARDRAQFALPPSLVAIEPGDVIALAGPGEPRHYRVTEIGDHGAREIDAIRIEPDVYAPIPATSRTPPMPPTIASGPPAAAFLDLPLLLGNESPDTGYFAAMLRPWPGTIALYQSPETSGFTLRAFATQPATMGETLDDLAAGPTSRLDNATRFRVRLDYGTLASVSDLALLSGANAAAIEHAPGDWEIIQFQNADPRRACDVRAVVAAARTARHGSDDVRVPRCGRPLRPPRLGAHHARPDSGRNRPALQLALWPVESRSRIDNVRDDGSRLRRHRPSSARARSRRAVAATPAISTSPGSDAPASAATVGKPPRSLSARTARAYALDIVDGDTVVRTLAASSPSATYTAADQAADFGAPPPAITVRIYQLSASYGRGSPAAATV